MNRSSAGKVLTFGSGLHGRCGHEQHEEYVPRLAEWGLEGIKISQVAAGERHTLLLSTEGNVYSFGDGQQGQLGVGDWDNSVRARYSA